jgi:hypothetical protein
MVLENDLVIFPAHDHQIGIAALGEATDFHPREPELDREMDWRMGTLDHFELAGHRLTQTLGQPGQPIFPGRLIRDGQYRDLGVQPLTQNGGTLNCGPTFICVTGRRDNVSQGHPDASFVRGSTRIPSVHEAAVKAAGSLRVDGIQRKS